MATTSSNPTVTGTPVSNPNNESPATLQRKLRGIYVNVFFSFYFKIFYGYVC